MSVTLIKAQCTNCGATLEVNQNKDAAICPYCNTPYVVEKAVNLYKTENHNKYIMDGANVHISSGVLDPDTMFENWLVTGNSKLRADFQYYYATDIRSQYFDLISKAYSCAGYPNGIDESCRCEEKIKVLIDQIFVGERFAKYKNAEIEKRIIAVQKRRHETERYERERLEAERRSKENREIEAQIKLEEARDSKRRKIRIAIIVVTVIILYAMIRSCVGYYS